MLYFLVINGIYNYKAATGTISFIGEPFLYEVEQFAANPMSGELLIDGNTPNQDAWVTIKSFMVMGNLQHIILSATGKVIYADAVIGDGEYTDDAFRVVGHPKTIATTHLESSVFEGITPKEVVHIITATRKLVACGSRL